MVQSRNHSSVATSEAYKSESGMKTKCLWIQNEYNRSVFGASFDHAHGRHHPTY